MHLISVIKCLLEKTLFVYWSHSSFFHTIHNRPQNSSRAHKFPFHLEISRKKNLEHAYLHKAWFSLKAWKYNKSPAFHIITGTQCVAFIITHSAVSCCSAAEKQGNNKSSINKTEHRLRKTCHAWFLSWSHAENELRLILGLT